MAYRSIEVNGKEYQFTVGKVYVKIHGMEAVLKHKIGTPHYDAFDDIIGYTVTPAMIKDYILSKQ